MVDSRVEDHRLEDRSGQRLKIFLWSLRCKVLDLSSRCWKVELQMLQDFLQPLEAHRARNNVRPLPSVQTFH